MWPLVDKKDHAWHRGSQYSCIRTCTAVIRQGSTCLLLQSLLSRKQKLCIAFAVLNGVLAVKQCFKGSCFWPPTEGKSDIINRRPAHPKRPVHREPLRGRGWTSERLHTQQWEHQASHHPKTSTISSCYMNSSIGKVHLCLNWLKPVLQGKMTMRNCEHGTTALDNEGNLRQSPAVWS